MEPASTADGAGRIPAAELFGYRALWLATTVLVVVLGVVHRFVGVRQVDPLPLRGAVLALSLVLLARSWWRPTAGLRPLVQVGVTVVTLWLVNLLWLNGLAADYALSLMIAVPGMAASFRSMKRLDAYLWVTNGAVLLAAWTAEGAQLSPAVVVVDVAAVSLLARFIAGAARQTESQLAASRERYEIAALGARDGLWDWDLGTGRIYYSPRWKAMLGYTDQDIGETVEGWVARVHPDDEPGLKAKLEAHLAGETPHFQREYRIRDGAGAWRWMLTRGVAVRDSSGRATRIAGSQTDISSWKAAEARLVHEAFHDSLTELPNRALFLDRLGRLTEHARRRAQYRFAVLFLDLDRFKIVNDGLGHPVGDELLKIVARRLLLCVRQEDTVARLGGDEFGILLAEVRGLADATRIAERVNLALQEPVRVGEHEVYTSASIGVALSAEGHARTEDIVSDADTAMYRAKASGGMRYEVEAGAMKREAAQRLRLEGELRRAVERGELRVQYQPMVEMDGGRLRGFEAVLRWQHSERGLLTADEFMPMAEESGIVLALDWWVLYRACEQAAHWAEGLAACAPGPAMVAVNLSGKHFWQEALVQRLDGVIAETHVQPAHLRLEIAESALLRDPGAAARVLTELDRRGIAVAIDDLGAGSLLAHAQQLPVRALKLDRAFVAHLGEDTRGSEMLEKILAVARGRELEVVAVGVETTEQLEALRRAGCRLAQGFFFSEPLDADGAGALLQAQVVAASPTRERRPPRQGRAALSEPDEKPLDQRLLPTSLFTSL